MCKSVPWSDAADEDQQDEERHRLHQWAEEHSAPLRQPFAGTVEDGSSTSS